MKLETHITSILEGEKKARLSKPFLRAASSIYRASTWLHQAHWSAFGSKTKLPVPVVSIGNIVAGGSGKTPLVHYLAKALSQKKVAILSRGYKRKSKKNLVVTEQMPADQCGDEPKLLKQKLASASVLVGRDRADLGHLACQLGAEIILLDDGLQHLKLHRDFEIITLDASNLLGRGHFLPYGYLRDDPKTLARADLLAVSGVRDAAHRKQVEKELRKWTKAPLVTMQKRFENQSEVAGKKVGAFCAIAYPNRFFNTLIDLQCCLASVKTKPDHHPFSVQELQNFSQEAKKKGAEILVCTEKDAVKWSSLPEVSLPIAALKLSVEPEFGKEFLEKLFYGALS